VTATVTGHPPTGPPVTGDDQETVTAGLAPSIKITKTAWPPTYDRRGQWITYTYTVTNTGNLTLSNISVIDSRFGAISCPQTTLAPGASMTCTATHIVTQADLDRGYIKNTATVTGHPPTGPPVTDKDQETVTARLAPSIKITKSAWPPTYSRPGQVVTYTYTVTNTGNLTLRDVSVIDSRLGAISCPRTTLAPGASMTCTASYTVTPADLDEGSIVNTATATGQPPTGQPVTSLPATVTVTAKPSLPVTG